MRDLPGRHWGCAKLSAVCRVLLGLALACSPDQPTGPPDGPVIGAVSSVSPLSTSGVPLVVPPPLVLGWGPYSYATDVSATGMVTGVRYTNSTFERLEAVRWAPNGTQQSLRVTSWTSAAGINASGEVALNTIEGPRRWNSDNSLTPLEVGQRSFVFARGINDAGIVVGEAVNRGTSEAVRWDLSGALTVLPRVSGSWHGSVAWAVNETGLIAGWYWPVDPEPVVWSPSGTATLLPVFGQDLYGYAYGLNNGGTVVGEAYTGTHSAAVQWQHGMLSALELPPGAERSGAFDVNDAGLIVGWIEWELSHERSPALWGPDGAYLGTLPPIPGDIGAAAVAIEGNYLVGSSTDSSGVFRAVRWTLPHSEFLFHGFFPPVRNGGALNHVKAGSSVPIKFAVGGAWEGDVLASNSPKTVAIECHSGRIINSTEQPTLSPNGLQHGAGQYVYVWRTEKAWAGSCREFVLALKDGTRHIALFRFR